MKPKRSHGGSCLCAACALVEGGASREEAAARIRGWGTDMLAKHGWFVHFVQDDPESPTRFNCHTHGLVEKDGHPDFQIVFPLPPPTLHGILSAIVERVKAGERFKAGQTVERVVGNGYEIKLVAAEEGGRAILRLIIPDRDGNLDVESLGGVFRDQYEGAGPQGLVS